MGDFTKKIDKEMQKNSYKEKNRTSPCYEIAFRADSKGVEEPKILPQVSARKSMTLNEFNEQINFVIEELRQFKGQNFVMMSNKKVCFDRQNASLFPRFEYCDLPAFSTVNRPLYNYPGFYFEGMRFEAMTPEECLKSFTITSGNPYLNEDGTFKHFTTQIKKSILVEGWTHKKSCCVNSKGEINYWADTDQVTMVPIFRLNGVNSNAMTFGQMIKSWLMCGLIPENLSSSAKKVYRFLLNIFDDIYGYFKRVDVSFQFDEKAFSAAVANREIDFQKLLAKGFGEDIKFAAPEKSAPKTPKTPLEMAREALCRCDYIRANIEPYDAKILTDVNGGHWELFEPIPEDAEIIKLEDNPFFARPPHLDVKDGIAAIDFGTKATVVVLQNGTDEKLLRIGQGNFSKAPEKTDYENPTVIELRDYTAFKAAYEARDGRPYTKWQQATFSHTANEVLNDAEKDTSIENSVFYSIFSELKQWANDKDRRMYLQDRNKKLVELNPYLELNDGDFDPIELYAYYLGLYINNMHTGICLRYMLSFPVTYEKKVREKILQSFERGIKKSLPPAILNDEELMEDFELYAGASEPAAYASCALGELKLQPKAGEKTAYAVFDFGGGTTDFDFGVESVPENKRSKFVIEQFGDTGRGDPYLGGENLLNLLAYEVYKNNLPAMREKQIPIALPYNCTAIDGAETIILKTKEAYVNRKRIAEFLRPFWEERLEESENIFSEPQKIKLYSKKEDKIIDVSLQLNEENLKNCLKIEIQRGIDNFFESLHGAFGEPEVLPIHILLAGNSCKSSIVLELFKKKIADEEQKMEEIIAEKTGKKQAVANVFELHMPLGSEQKTEIVEINENGETETAAENTNFERLRTGKTGVAFGLLRSREGGRDVKIIGVQNEAPFPFYLGKIDDDDYFSVIINTKVPYNEWRNFTFADSKTFEIYYTKEAMAVDGKLPRAKVQMMRCKIDKEDVSDDKDIYLRKVSPDTIEYAVGTDEDFAGGNFSGKIYKATIKLQED